MTTGELIALNRKNAGLSQKELAQMVDTTPQNISQYERGIRQPKIKTLSKIAVALGVGIDTLLGGLETFDTGAEFDAAWKKAVETAGNDQITIVYTQDPKKTVSGLMDLLNERGQAAAIDRIQELTEIPRYRRTAPETALTPPAGESDEKEAIEE